MVLQNKHKQLASKQYKKLHGIGSDPSSSSSSSSSRPRETGQERQLRLGSNADRYIESDDDEDDDVNANGASVGDADEVDEELIAHKRAEAEALREFLAEQQTRLSSRGGNDRDERSDDDDVDASFAHLQTSAGNKKGKTVIVTDDRDMKGLEGEARRAQAIRDLKDRFSSSPHPSMSTRKPPPVRKPPPLPGMGDRNAAAGPGETRQRQQQQQQRGGEDFLDSLL
ncbi:hypothetical protein JCM3766R1_003547 [Sporobolomyces carnicolor]